MAKSPRPIRKLQLSRRDDPAAPAYLSFQPDCPPEQAIAFFEEKYGEKPAEIMQGETLLAVGPVPPGEEGWQ